MYDLKLREEELKNKVAHDYFSKFDSTKIIGNVDFCIALQQEQPSLFEQESLLWAESKSGKNHDIYESFVQLIITIGKARTFDKELPPAFLGAFDAEKIGFLPYYKVIDVFYQNDFNWNVTPSDHSTKEFKQLLDLVQSILDKETLIYKFTEDDTELRKFISENFKIGKSNLSKIGITKNNFISIYGKWIKDVKTSIAVNWDIAKKNGILDADFFLADLLSEHNLSLKENLYVLLRNDHYELDRQLNEMGLFSSQTAQFNDNQKAHTQFWNRYNRPPKRDYWNYIVERRDLLVPQDVRERKGSYFTPQIWVEKSQQYLADALGENWQDEYYIWDCCAGTGNMEVGLTNKYKVWASTIDQADVDVMKDRIKNGANLLESHVFQFDFLNDEFSKLPQGLQDIVNNDEKRRKLVIYINPPYAEAANKETISGYGSHKKNVAVKTKVYEKYQKLIGIAGRELFAQFFIRIYCEIPGCILGEFSKLKILQSPNFEKFRNVYKASLEKIFLVPANTFDNVKGQFPIGFFVWNLFSTGDMSNIKANIYDSKSVYVGEKIINVYKKTESINDWIILTRKRKSKVTIGFMACLGCDFQHNDQNYIMNSKDQMADPRGSWICDSNLREVVVYYATRHCIEATWLNDRELFLFPNNSWKYDNEFQNDCLAWTLFNNNIQSKYGINHWIPFTETEVDAKNEFESHFMTDFIQGKMASHNHGQIDLFETQESFIPTEPLQFSAEAKTVFDAGLELWKYYHAQPNANSNASLYDIKEFFQGRNGKGKMNNDSDDEHYMELIKNLRETLKVLAKKIEPKVYEYGFLK